VNKQKKQVMKWIVKMKQQMVLLLAVVARSMSRHVLESGRWIRCFPQLRKPAPWRFVFLLSWKLALGAAKTIFDSCSNGSTAHKVRQF
jgi:hypothetical protein